MTVLANHHVMFIIHLAIDVTQPTDSLDYFSSYTHTLHNSCIISNFSSCKTYLLYLLFARITLTDSKSHRQPGIKTLNFHVEFSILVGDEIKKFGTGSWEFPLDDLTFDFNRFKLKTTDIICYDTSTLFRTLYDFCESLKLILHINIALVSILKN